jgi:hypothetical protein
MPRSQLTYYLSFGSMPPVLGQDTIGFAFIGTLQGLKCRADQVKQIVNCIHQDCGIGYIWSTTGSDKTLISFTASTLQNAKPDTVKCIFIAERKLRLPAPVRIFFSKKIRAKTSMFSSFLSFN